jgi:FkbM family methyltransferase
MDEGLVYDVGGYDGSDTAHYLSLGYRVLCIEAAPDLAERLLVRFHHHVADGRCKILNVAIGERNGHLPFYLSSLPFLSSFDRSIAGRDGCQVTEITVPTRTFGSILDEHGVPYFLKLDIEGSDDVCLKALGEDLPKYLSFEASKDSLDEILTLIKLGYSRFSLIRQNDFQPVTIPFPGTTSHLGWSARQFARMKLRSHPRLHRAVVNLAGRLASLQQKRSSGPEVKFSSGPTPMERRDGWYAAEEFVHVWTSAAHGGMIDSAVWYDVHAVRDGVDAP